MATKEQIKKEILRKHKNEVKEVDWKELALRLLEWQSNLYPGEAPTIIYRSMRKVKDSK